MDLVSNEKENGEKLVIILLHYFVLWKKIGKINRYISH